MGESNQIKWRGVRQTNPREPFYVQNRPAIGDQIFEYGYIDNGTLVVFTVPTGHVYHLIGFGFSHYFTVEAYGHASIIDNLGNTVGIVAMAQRSSVGQDVSNFGFICPVSLPAGYHIDIYSNVANAWVWLTVVCIDEVL